MISVKDIDNIKNAFCEIFRQLLVALEQSLLLFTLHYTYLSFSIILDYDYFYQFTNL